MPDPLDSQKSPPSTSNGESRSSLDGLLKRLQLLLSILLALLCLLQHPLLTAFVGSLWSLLCRSAQLTQDGYADLFSRLARIASGPSPLASAMLVFAAIPALLGTTTFFQGTFRPRMRIAFAALASQWTLLYLLYAVILWSEVDPTKLWALPSVERVADHLHASAGVCLSFCAWFTVENRRRATGLKVLLCTCSALMLLLAAIGQSCVSWVDDVLPLLSATSMSVWSVQLLRAQRRPVGRAIAALVFAYIPIILLREHVVDIAHSRLFFSSYFECAAGLKIVLWLLETNLANGKKSLAKTKRRPPKQGKVLPLFRWFRDDRQASAHQAGHSLRSGAGTRLREARSAVYESRRARQNLPYFRLDTVCHRW